MGDSEIYHTAVLMYVRYSGSRRQEQMMSHEAGYIYMPAVYYEFSKYSYSLTLGYLRHKYCKWWIRKPFYCLTPRLSNCVVKKLLKLCTATGSAFEPHKISLTFTEPVAFSNALITYKIYTTIIQEIR